MELKRVRLENVSHSLSGTILILWVCHVCMMPVLADHGQGPDLPVNRVLRERVAAWDKTIAYTDERVPNSAVLTYMHDHAEFVYFNFLAKIMPSAVINGEKILITQAQDVKVEDFPGFLIKYY